MPHLSTNGTGDLSQAIATFDGRGGHGVRLLNDPTTDITATASVDFVTARGHIYRHHSHRPQEDR